MKIVILILLTLTLTSCNRKVDKKNQIHTTSEKFEMINTDELNKILAMESENLTAQEVMELFYPKKVETGEGNEKKHPS